MKDVTTEFIHLADYKIEGGCTACYECYKKPSFEKLCYYYNDDFNLILKKMLTGDGFIFGCPVYTGSVTSQWKVFVDRQEPFCALGNPLRNKPFGAVTCALGRVAGQEHVIADIIRYGMQSDMIPLNTMVSWPVEGMASPWGVAGQQGYPKQIGSVEPGNKEAVKQDVIALACCKILGLRVAEMAKVIKAGFILVNPENGETKWPAGVLTEEYREDDLHAQYAKKK